MADIYLKDPILWKKKARAFVTRTHRHLWGKNNEDPLIFLFKQDLTNQFAKDMLLGWNKHGQERTMEKWGIDGQANSLSLPPGIVFPYIVEKELLSVWIHPMDPCGIPYLVPGSAKGPILLGNPKNPVKKVDRLFNGLRLFQEKKDLFCVEIHA